MSHLGHDAFIEYWTERFDELAEFVEETEDYLRGEGLGYGRVPGSDECYSTDYIYSDDLNISYDDAKDFIETYSYLCTQ